MPVFRHNGYDPAGSPFSLIDRINVGRVRPFGGIIADVLVVGGGGGGGSGYTSQNNGGGGGGGGVVYNQGVFIPFGIYLVTVGAGGAANTNGGNSIFNDITAYGGGHGGGLIPSTVGADGASGGGGACAGSKAGGSGISGQGCAGGPGYSSSPYQAGGGGGAGENGNTDGFGFGGDGVACSITGASVYYGGGGGGGNDSQTLLGGDGGGGTGGRPDPVPPTAGAANTGGGGGGGASQGSSITGASGGSGVVIIRYKTSEAPINMSGGDVTTDGDYTIRKYTVQDYLYCGVSKIVNLALRMTTVGTICALGGRTYTKSASDEAVVACLWSTQINATGPILVGETADSVKYEYVDGGTTYYVTYRGTMSYGGKTYYYSDYGGFMSDYRTDSSGFNRVLLNAAYIDNGSPWGAVELLDRYFLNGY